MPDDEFGNALKKQAYADANMSQDMQLIPARHGTATFVPSGSVIKIVNTSGTQVVDTWAFALPNPPSKNGEKKPEESKKEEPKAEEKKEEKPVETEAPKPTPKKQNKKKDKDMGLPSQEEAEQATSSFNAQQDAANGEANGETAKKSGWSSYIPSIGLGGGKAASEDQTKKDAQTKENSRSWGQYFSAGQGFSSYVPGRDSVSAFTSKVRALFISITYFG